MALVQIHSFVIPSAVLHAMAKHVNAGVNDTYSLDKSVVSERLEDVVGILLKRDK